MGDMIIYSLNVFGTFAFAISGAISAVKYRLDLLGVLVLSIITGIGGGVLRDIFIGFVPPSGFRDETYFIACIMGGLFVFFHAPRIVQCWNIVLIADAIGLGVFTATGTAIALENNHGVIGVLLLGALTATGGGVLRDILIREIPVIIQKDFYATASLLGGIVSVILAHYNVEKTVIVFSCMFATILVRLAAMRYRLALPRAGVS